MKLTCVVQCPILSEGHWPKHTFIRDISSLPALYRNGDGARASAQDAGRGPGLTNLHLKPNQKEAVNNCYDSTPRAKEQNKR